MGRRLRDLLATLALALPAAMPAAADTALEISDAWIREAPPGSTVLAGYMTIINDGGTLAVVQGVSSEDFNSVEIHRTVITDGVARMLATDRLQIPAGGRVSLAPGGYHLMLFNPARPLLAGDTVELLLHSGGDQCLAVTVPVRRHAPAAAR